MRNIIVISIVTFFVIVGLYYADRSLSFTKLSKKARLCIVGVILGLCSVGAAFSPISIHGTDVSAAMANSMGAGLLFGGPAGYIAAVIGAIGRWFATPWGSGDFTRFPEAISILLGGIFGSLLRKKMLDDRTPNWKYCLVFTTGITAVYVMLIFFLNYKNTQVAFQLAKETALPMWICNSLIIVFSSIAIIWLTDKGAKKEKSKSNDITDIFQHWMFIIIIGAVIFCGIFVGIFQTGISWADTKQQLQVGLDEICQDMNKSADDNLLKVCRFISLEVERGKTGAADLDNLKDKYGISEINIVNDNGIITESTIPEYVGFDMTKGNQSAAFMKILTDKEGVVQDFQKIAYSDSIRMKYAGYPLETGGFVQIGINEPKFDAMTLSQFENAIAGHHIGKSGYYALLDNDWKLIYASKDSVGFIEELPHENVMQLYHSKKKGSIYYMYTVCDSKFKVMDALPQEEAMYFRDIAAFVTIYVVLIVFIAIFVNLFVLVKRLVIDNINDVNDSLSKIIGGNLNTSVNVNGTTEFASLSRDINTTVDTLKKYIAEAGKRLDMELAFAKAIQYSTLPSDFMTDHEEFEIYGSMFTAKEVGGDFFDFYLLDGNRLALVMADVSGKGIPAAMFMMESKAIIKSLAESGKSVNEIFNEANARLCHNNESEMFVTALMGIIELDTGIVHYTNAAHTTPAICDSDAGFEFRKVRPSLMLGGMEGTRYRAYETQLKPGDKIYLYTDGVTEATNSETKLYGQERLNEVLNAHKDASSKDLCTYVKESVDEFTGEAEQFDDITMLAFCFKGKKA
jgi:serine phosphatase RsbU (regulator of sigma subunit)